MLDLAGSAIRRLFGVSMPHDGQAAEVEEIAGEAGAPLAATVQSTPARPQRAVARPETVISAALAQKLLHGWMQNRYQTRYPLILNLRNHDPAEAALLIEAVHYALRSTDASKEAVDRAGAWVASVGGRLGPLDDSDTRHLIDRVHAARLAPQAYAACAGALGRRTVADRRFLDFLAARLDLPDDVARSLNRRFAS